MVWGDSEARKGQHPSGASRCVLGLGKQHWLPTRAGGTLGMEGGAKWGMVISDASWLRTAPRS